MAVYHFSAGVNWLNRVQGLATTGNRVIIRLFISLKSCTSLDEPSGFFTGSTGVLNGDMQGSNEPLAINLSISGWSPCRPSCDIGYCFILPGISGFLMLTSKGAISNFPTESQVYHTSGFICSSSFTVGAHHFTSAPCF